MNVFRQTQPIDKSRFQLELASNEPERMTRAIMDAADGIDDYHWLLDQFTKLLSHSDVWVVRTAIVGISYLARIHSDEASRDVLLSLVQPFLEDDRFGGYANDTIEDIDIFLPA